MLKEKSNTEVELTGLWKILERVHTLFSVYDISVEAKVSPLQGLSHSIRVSLSLISYHSSVQRIKAPYSTLILLEENHVRPRATTFPN